MSWRALLLLMLRVLGSVVVLRLLGSVAAGHHGDGGANGTAEPLKGSAIGGSVSHRPSAAGRRQTF